MATRLPFCTCTILACLFAFLPTTSNAGIADRFQQLFDSVTTRGEQKTGLSPRCNSTIDEQTIAKQTIAQLIEGVTTPPVSEMLMEGNHGNGELSVGLGPGTAPFLASDESIYAAATGLSNGRIVVFSGQEFLGSQQRSTLLENPNIAQLLKNAVVWASGKANPTVLAANDRVAAALRDGSSLEVTTADHDLPNGLLTKVDWSADAIRNFDVLVVQINEWGTLYLSAEDLVAVREFVESGGGLILSGTRLHWEWWLQGLTGHSEFPGNKLLAGTGISFLPTLDPDMTDAVTGYDDSLLPEVAWCDYVNGSLLTNRQAKRLPPLFSSAHGLGRNRDLDAALNRLILETPPLPAKRDEVSAELSARVLSTLSGPEWPEGHPWASAFPGIVSPNAEPIDAVVTIDSKWKRRRPTGLYAPAGQVVTIEIAEELLNNNFAIIIGDPLTPTLDGYAAADVWERAPVVQQVVLLQQPSTTVSSGLGGALYLWIPDYIENTEIELGINGGVPMATYSHGLTSTDEFLYTLSLGAPQAILETPGKISLVVPASDAADSMPDSVMNFWDGFYDSHAALAQEPVDRMFNSHWLFTPQVGWGYANASAQRIHYPDSVISSALRTSSGTDDWWLFAHELGHQFQTANWTGPDTVEVLVNLWSLYTLNFYLNDGGDYDTLGYEDFHSIRDITRLRDKGWQQADFFERLELYRQLIIHFGWTPIKQVMRSYYDGDFPVDTYLDGDIDGFAVRMSWFSERDLTEYFDVLSYPLSDVAREKINAFNLQTWLPEGL